jgi:hypothetical protein
MSERVYEVIKEVCRGFLFFQGEGFNIVLAEGVTFQLHIYERERIVEITESTLSFLEWYDPERVRQYMLGIKIALGRVRVIDIDTKMPGDLFPKELINNSRCVVAEDFATASKAKKHLGRITR